MSRAEKTVFLILADGLSDNRWNAEHEKARRLADAAPDMLEALEYLVRPKADMLYSSYLLLAARAIAKAKGETT